MGYNESNRSYKFLPEGKKNWVSVRTMWCNEQIFPKETVKQQDWEMVETSDEVKESQMWHQGEPATKKHTVVGVTTHNNGGFKVKETPEEIIEKIRMIRNLSPTYIIL